MAEKLTDQQRLAVENKGGALLVSAAAGSGKTKVLVERLLKNVMDPENPVNIDEFLIITYTKAAASELRAKIAAALTSRIADDPTNIRLQNQFQRLYLTKISTVHSFCTDILREYAYLLDLPSDFRMIESDEDLPLRYQIIDKLLAESYDHLGDDPDFACFVDTQGVGRDDSSVPELILKVYDSAKCHMDSERWLQNCIDAMETSHFSDAADTEWGRFLMEDISRKASYYLDTISAVQAQCKTSPGLEKMIAALDLVSAQLHIIRDAKKWDVLHELNTLDVGDIKGVANKKNIDKDLYRRASLVRNVCKETFSKELAVFGNSSEQVLSDLISIKPAVRGLIELVRKFSVQYDKLKKNMHVLDFSDLEHKALDLFVGKSRSGPTEIANQVGGRYFQIMVDEYQDSNEVQDGIFTALTHNKHNLFMVGDVKQSIYQFRLADPRIFLDKYDHYVSPKEAEAGQGRKLILSNNFRSSKAVIDGVNHVFRTCMSKRVGDLDYSDDEALWEGVPHEALPDPAVELHVIDADDNVYLQESKFVADRIMQLLDGKHMIRDGEVFRPIRPDDIAILLRSPKSNAMVFHEALAERGLRTVSSVNLDLLTTDEVQWLRNLLCTLNNPRQDIPLIGTLCGPVFGFDADDLASIRALARNIPLYDALVISDLPKAKSFVSVLDQLRFISRMHTLTELIEAIFTLTNAKIIYSAKRDGQVRCQNLQSFYQYVVKFSSTPGADLQKLLRNLKQSEKEGLRVERQGVTAGCIQITSIHKSKGLEYPVVFLCGLSKRFNFDDIYEKLLCDDKLGIGLSCVDPSTRIRYPSVCRNAIAAKMIADTVSEQMRILYVAMTRPKDRLIMTYSARNVTKDLSELVTLMDYAPKLLHTSEARCMGDWVLYSALRRYDAGHLFVECGKPDVVNMYKDQWLITYNKGRSVVDIVDEEEKPNDFQISSEQVVQLKRALEFKYPHKAATLLPSKQTATQRKGRQKDREVLENTVQHHHFERKWRKPAFILRSADGREFGNAVHAFMQYCKFECCSDLFSICKEIERLVDRGFLTCEQADMIDAKKISALFATDIGKKMCRGDRVLREFKFSILDNAADYSDGVADEKVLLQGVVDCAIIEDDGITVVDFKTDRVTEETVDYVADKYRSQIKTYADALTRIFETPVKESALYFFGLDRMYWL